MSCEDRRYEPALDEPVLRQHSIEAKFGEEF